MRALAAERKASLWDRFSSRGAPLDSVAVVFARMIRLSRFSGKGFFVSSFRRTQASFSAGRRRMPRPPLAGGCRRKSGAPKRNRPCRRALPHPNRLGKGATIRALSAHAGVLHPPVGPLRAAAAASSQKGFFYSRALLQEVAESRAGFSASTEEPPRLRIAPPFPLHNAHPAPPGMESSRPLLSFLEHHPNIYKNIRMLYEKAT